MQLSHFVAKLLPKMQFSALTILFALSICALKPNVESGSFVFEVTFPTRIDHFNPTNQNLTKFFYHVNTKYFRHGGPAYIYIKDINDQSTKWIESGLMVDIARTTGALLLTFDMRFFGKNRPTSDASVESLALLTVDQSLADIAVFIRFVRKSLKETCSTVILWGSGYGAALAAWARQRYPHLVAGSWASSGSFYPSAFTYVPIEHLRLLIVNEKGSPDYVCRDNLEQVYKMLNKLIENGDGKYISDKFNLCGQVYTDWKEDVAAFYELIIKTIFDYIDHYHFNGVKSLCSSIENQKSDDLLDAFANWFYTAKMKLSSAVLTDVLKYCCNHNYDGIVSDRNEYEWDSYFTYSGKRQWRYLQCTQLGGFLITNMLTWIPQRITRDYHMKKCNKAFGTSIDFETLEMAVTNLDVEFDNLDQNILYTASEMDPWKIFTRAFDSQGESITIDDFGKSSELASVSADDSPSLYKAKKFVSNLITKWSTNQDENSSEDLKNRHILDLSFRYREMWWELSGENKEWDDNDWAKVYDLMLSVADGKNGLEETINDETEAQVMDEDGSIGAMDDVSDERFDDVENDELQKLFDLLKNPEEQDPDGNSKEDQILNEAIIMVELALKFTKMNYDVCDDDGNIYDEMDDISQWYSTKIFENWAQPMDFLKIDDKFKRNYKLAMEWLDNDLYKLDFENEFKNVDTNEFRILYITSKLSLEYDKYRTEGSSRFWMSEDV